MGCGVQKVGSYWQVRAFGGTDLSVLSSLTIAYEDPDGNTGTLAATVDPDDNRFALADFTALIGTVAGNWKFEIAAQDVGGNPIISYETAIVELKARYG